MELLKSVRASLEALKKMLEIMFFKLRRNPSETKRVSYVWIEQ